ncbi:MAG TPA: phosphotransferase family protein [Microscillaceae bacterium]|nr:phosphotransferase family protein [Microscillaceae bacterium]
MSTLDEARSEIRAGEELNQAALQTYLQTVFNAPQDALTILQFPGGHSNLTYLLNFGNRELVLRRPPFGAEELKNAHNMGREFQYLSLLHPVYDKVPQPLHYCDDKQVIGTPFYVMERKKGIVLRNHPPEGIALTPTKMRQLCELFVDNLIDLHQIDVYASGLIQMGKPEGFLARQIKGATERYQHVALGDVSEAQQLADWLWAHIPSESKIGIIHNDYKFDNIMYSADQMNSIVAVLDWEMATVGDVYCDLAATLGYWVEKGEYDALNTFATKQAGSFNRRELLECYEEKTKSKITHIPFYYALTCYRNAVIVQQLYYRFHKGYTQDQRLGGLKGWDKIFFQLGLQTIQTGKISNF